MARHRLRRFSQIGVPRGRVQDWARRERRGAGGDGLLGDVQDAIVLRDHSLQAHHFYAYQVHASHPGRMDYGKWSGRLMALWWLGVLVRVCGW